MKCVTCSTTDSSLLTLQTFVDNNTLNEISLVLPYFEIPTSKGPVYVCVTCQDQVTMFYRIKRTSLNNLYHLNHYQDILKLTSDGKFNDLKIIINNNKIPATQEQDIDFKFNTNCEDLTDDENLLIEKDSKLPDGEKSKKPSPSKEKLFKCHDCAKVFTLRRKLHIHSRVHTMKKPYKCTTCHKSFTTPTNLKAHNLVHTNEKPHECNVCHKTFTQSGSLSRHMSTHTSHTQHECDVCGKTYIYKINLTLHKRSHRNERPYKCAVCSKTFTQSGSLSVHMRIHTGQKPHQCHMCQNRFTQAGALKQHMRVHTGETPYTCELCNKSFTRSNALKEHKRKLHNN